MAIAATTTNELNIDAIVRMAHVHSGLLSVYQNVDAARGAYAKSLLDTILKELENEGLFAKSISFESVTLVSGVFQYTMPTDCLDVIGIGMWISADQVGSPNTADELPVKDILRDQWQTLTSKGAEARPLMYYCHRVDAVPAVWLWPTPGPSEAGSRIRFQVHRLRADATDGTKTLDYERYWTQFFIWELAHQLSIGAGKALDRVQYLSAQATQKKKMAKMYSAQRPDMQLVIGHSSGRRRR
jgi:hypothetical protein